MKKNIRAVMMIAAVALIAGVNVFNSQRAIAMSDIALANVEALVVGEIIIGMPCLSVPNNYCIYIGQTPDQDFVLPGAFVY